MSMPATAKVVEDLKAEQPFSDVHVFLTQHGFDDNETEIHALLELGLQPKNLFCFLKTGTRPLVAGRLRERGINIYDNAYDLRHSRNPFVEPLVKFIDDAFSLKGKTLDEQIAQLREYERTSEKNRPKVLLVDEGFKVGKVLVTLQQSDNELVREKYRIIANLCPMVAHTEGDLIKGGKGLAQAEEKAKELGRAVPILPRTINMARSPAKKFEGNLIGQSVWLDTYQLLHMLKEPEAIALRPKETLVVGYGVVAAKAQPQLQAGHNVWIWDVDPKALLQAYRDKEARSYTATAEIHIPVDKRLLERVVARGGDRNDKEFVDALMVSKKEWFAHGHMVVSNTGAPGGSLRAEDFEHLPAGAILASGASGDYEFGTNLARKENPYLKKIHDQDGKVEFPLAGNGSDPLSVRVSSGDEGNFDHQVYETHSKSVDPKRFMILRGGYAANRLYGLPPAAADLTVAIMIQSMHQAIQPDISPRPKSGLWLVECDSDGQDKLMDIVDANLVKNNLGTLANPNFANLDIHWHRPAVPFFPTIKNEIKKEIEGEGRRNREGRAHTSERYVRSGLAACKQFNLSPLSFALKCDTKAIFGGSDDLRTLQQEIWGDPYINNFFIEVQQPQRTIAHTLYAIFAQHGAAQDDLIDEKAKAIATQLGFDDLQWQKLLATRDMYSLVPKDYAASSPSSNHAEDIRQKARRSLQQGVSTITVGAPTQEQLRGIAGRKEMHKKILELLGTF